MGRTVIRGGTRVTGSGTHTGDIAFENGVITDVAGYIDLKGDDILINAQGYYIFPGVIDALTFIEFDNGKHQSIDDWESSTRAAAAGGVTTVLAPIVKDAETEWDDLLEAMEAATRDAVVDFGYHALLTPHPIKAKNLLASLAEHGISTVLVYTVGPLMLDDAALLALLREAAEHNLLVLVIAENNAIIADAKHRVTSRREARIGMFKETHPVEAEWEATNRVLFLAELAGAAVCFARCTSEHSIELIREAWVNNHPAVAGSHPVYLLLDNGVYDSNTPEQYLTVPPLRSIEEQSALWDAIKTGALTVLTSGSIDFSLRQRRDEASFVDAPMGLPSMELLLPLMYTYGVMEKRIGLNDMVRLLSEIPARVFGLAARKGFLEKGHDADIILYDAEAISTINYKTLHHSSDYSPLDGLRLQGSIVTTISRGVVVSQNGEVIGRRGHGQFLERRPVDIHSLLL